MSTKRQPICIAGMHRTGSSMTTRAINLLGIEIGNPNELQPATESNVEGHWEHMKFMLANDAILEAIGHAWDYPPPVDVSWRDELGEHETIDRARRAIEELAPRGWWGWKDPRNSLTLDVWAELIPGMRIVVCLRHPVSVAMSLRSRQNMSFACGVNLWIDYYEHLLARLDAFDSHVVEYEQVLATPETDLAALAQWLGIDSPDAIARACASIDPGHNHQPPDQTLVAQTPARAWELYEHFQQLAAKDRGGEAGRDRQVEELRIKLEAARLRLANAPDVDQQLADLRFANADLEAQLALAVGQRDEAIHRVHALEQGSSEQALRIEELERAREALEASLAAVLSSTSWRVTRPLRFRRAR